MRNFRKMAYPYIVWISLVVVLPLLLIVFYAFTVKGSEVTTFSFSLQNFYRFLNDGVYLRIMGKSLYIAFFTTLTCLLLGYPIAYIISKKKKHTQFIIILLITMPMWINVLVKTYAWIGILQKNGLLANIALWFGIKDVNLVYTDIAVAIGMIYNFIPFMILQIYNGLVKIDDSYLQASSDLGATKWQTFKRIVFPLSIPGIISGITLVFLPTVSSFVIPKLLGGGEYVLVGNLIETQFITSGEWHFGSAISMIMAIIILLSMFLVKKVDMVNADE